jgi:hypothetical protein
MLQTSEHKKILGTTIKLLKKNKATRKKKEVEL